MPYFYHMATPSERKRMTISLFPRDLIQYLSGGFRNQGHSVNYEAM